MADTREKTWDLVMKVMRCMNKNRPLPSSKNSQFQNGARRTTFLMKMSFTRIKMKNHFHIKGWAPNLALKQRPDGTHK